MNKLSRFLGSRKVQGIALALLVIIILVLLLQTYHKANRECGTDFTSYLLSARALMHGENPYYTDTPFPYLYSMFPAFALIPLTWMPYWLSVFLWYLMNLGALLYVLIFALRYLRSPGFHFGLHDWIVPVTLVFILFFGVIQNNFLNGQINFIVLFLCILFLKLVRDGDIFLPSFILAAAISIKIAPAILLLYILLERRPLVFFLSLIFSMVFCFLPVILLGGKILTIYREYVSSFLISALETSFPPEKELMFFTLHGFWGFLVPWLKNSMIVRWISICLILLPIIYLHVLTAGFGRQIKNKGINNHVDYSLSLFSLYLLSILLITPMSETHHLALMLPAVMLMICRLVSTAHSGEYYQLAIFILFMACFLVGGAYKFSPLYFISIMIMYIYTWKQVSIKVAS